MRVLLAVHHYPPARIGGAENIAHRMARWLTQAGAQVRVVCVEDVNPQPEVKLTWQDEVYEGVPVRRLNLPLSYPGEARLLYDSPLIRKHMAQIIAEWKPDVLHLFSGYLLGAAPILAADSAGIPVVVTLLDFWFLCPTIQLLRGDTTLCAGPEPVECARCLADDRRSLRALDQRAPALVAGFWHAASRTPVLEQALHLPRQLDTLAARQAALIPALNRASAIICLTRTLADLHIANGAQAAKMIIMPNWLDLNEFDPAPQASPPPSDTLRLVYIGQIVSLKGVDLAVRAVRRVQKQNPARKISLAIYGNPAAQPDYTRALRSLAGDSHAIEFCGPYAHRQTLQVLASYDAVIVPSLWRENSPRVVLEAFAARRPVIGTRVGGIAEIVTDGKNGLLFERGSAVDLARALQQLLDEPSLLETLRRGIPPPETFDADMRAVMDIYKRVCAPAAEPRSRYE